MVERFKYFRTHKKDMVTKKKKVGQQNPIVGFGLSKLLNPQRIQKVLSKPKNQKIIKDLTLMLVKPLLKSILVDGLSEKKLTKLKAPTKKKKKTSKVDSRHDLCKCGKVKLKSSKYCRACYKIKPKRKPKRK